MIVADELEADWARVKIEQALGDEKYGSQNTDGSCSIRDFYDAMRDGRRTARTMLESAAAAQVGRAGRGVQGAESLKSFTRRATASSAYGELAPLAAAAAGAEAERPELQVADRVPLHRQGHADRSISTISSRARARSAWTPNARHGLRLDRAPAGARRQAQELRRLRRRSKVNGVQQVVMLEALSRRTDSRRWAAWP